MQDFIRKERFPIRRTGETFNLDLTPQSRIPDLLQRIYLSEPLNVHCCHCQAKLREMSETERWYVTEQWMYYCKSCLSLFDTEERVGLVHFPDRQLPDDQHLGSEIRAHPNYDKLNLSTKMRITELDWKPDVVDVDLLRQIWQYLYYGL